MRGNERGGGIATISTKSVRREQLAHAGGGEIGVVQHARLIGETEQFGEMPFVGIILAVGDDWVEISPNDPTDPDRRMRGTRTSRPVVSAKEALE